MPRKAKELHRAGQLRRVHAAHERHGRAAGLQLLQDGCHHVLCHGLREYFLGKVTQVIVLTKRDTRVPPMVFVRLWACTHQAEPLRVDSSA